tara:strand:+ start:92 stop:193 length:102 start_codon:yes stop_codon:yes gene_type:complete
MYSTTIRSGNGVVVPLGDDDGSSSDEEKEEKEE